LLVVVVAETLVVEAGLVVLELALVFCLLLAQVIP
jgi:hypothetical protein